MSLNRRQLLTASPCHIVSLVVQVNPNKYEATCTAIRALPGADIPVSEPDGRLVVLLESSDESAMLGTISQLEALDGIISSNLAYHQVDDQ